MRKLSVIGLFLLTLAGCATKRVTINYSPQEIIHAVDNRSYQFRARFVQPASGRTRELTGGNYVLKVTREEVSADLPYFGRAYSAPIGADAGIKFTSNDFEYKEETGKKGRKEISITVRNSQVVRELNLTLFEDGSADLRVTPTNKQFISYRGEVSPMVN